MDVITRWFVQNAPGKQDKDSQVAAAAANHEPAESGQGQSLSASVQSVSTNDESESGNQSLLAKKADNKSKADVSSSQQQQQQRFYDPKGGTLTNSSSMAMHEHDSSLPFIHLTPLQSCSIHGWLNPKRTLHWNDIRTNSSVTLQKCLKYGVSPHELKLLQPDVHMWVQHKQVSLSDVPHMQAWPLHPVLHLKANIGDLATMHYDASLLMHLGISYGFMRNHMRMTDEWMRMLRYTPAEWGQIGLTRDEALRMGKQRLQFVFEGMDFNVIVMQVSAHELQQL